jgi:hypothetical protein
MQENQEQSITRIYKLDFWASSLLSSYSIKSNRMLDRLRGASSPNSILAVDCIGLQAQNRTPKREGRRLDFCHHKANKINYFAKH